MDRVFSLSDPKAQMKIVTKIERVQPTMAGIDEHGEIMWEGRAMERWQMELFRKCLDWAGSRYARWREVFYFQNEDRAFLATDSMIPDEDKAATKSHIDERRRMYRERTQFRQAVGD